MQAIIQLFNNAKRFDIVAFDKRDDGGIHIFIIVVLLEHHASDDSFYSNFHCSFAMYLFFELNQA